MIKQYNNNRQIFYSIFSNRHFHLLAFIFFYLLLIYEYIHFVTPIFSDKGFLLKPETNRIILGVILFIVLSTILFLFNNSSKFIYALSLFAGMSFSTPSIIMYQLSDINLLIPILSIIFIFFLTSKYLNFPTIKISKLKFNQQKYIILILAILLIIPFIVTYGVTLNKNVFSLGKEIYDVRADAYINSNLFTAYAFGPLTKVLLPCLIIYGILQKDRLLWITGIVLMLYIFMVNPHKSVLFSIFVIIVFAFFKDYNIKASIMIIGIIAIIVLSIFFSMTTGNILPESIFVRRMFFLPVLICDEYFSFFNNNHIYLSHSVLSPFFEYPYDLEPAFLMGKHIFNNPNTSCNTGIISDGFMNFGIIGSLVFSFLAAIIIRFLDSLKMHHSFFGISFLYLILFLNSALFTILLTHGALFFIIIGFLFLKNTNYETK